MRGVWRCETGMGVGEVWRRETGIGGWRDVATLDKGRRWEGWYGMVGLWTENLTLFIYLTLIYKDL